MAGKMYTWVDELGVTHFTDNLFNVPLQYRNEPVEELEDFAEAKANGGASPKGGNAIWVDKCSMCHILDDETNAGLISLSTFLTDESGRNVPDPQLLSMGLSDALDKKHDKLLFDGLSKGDVNNLGAFLSKRQLKIIAESPENL